MDAAACAERRAAWQSGTTLAEREAALAAVIRRQLARYAPPEPTTTAVTPREDYL